MQAVNNRKKGFTPLEVIYRKSIKVIRSSLFAVKRNNTSRAHFLTGFTIIEAIVAIAIISLAIVVPLSLSRQSLSTMTRARNYITATYLAQEGIELVHYIRDNNMLAEIDWLTDLDSCYGNGCLIHPDTQTVVACSGSCQPLRYSYASGEYGYSSGNDSLFTRTIILTPIGSDAEGPYEVQVESTVSFGFKGRTQSIMLKENIYRW